MNRVKNATESTDIRLDYAEERICEIEDRSFGIMKSEEKQNEKRRKKACVTYGLLWRETIYTLLESQGKRGIKGAESIFKEIIT